MIYLESLGTIWGFLGVVVGACGGMAFVCLTSLDLPTSARIDGRDSDHRSRSVCGVRVPNEPRFTHICESRWS